MVGSEVDLKYLGILARFTEPYHSGLSAALYKLLGLSTLLSRKLLRARKQRKLDPTRPTKSLDLYRHIIWMAREGHTILESMLEIVSHALSAEFSELRVLVFKLRASFLHVFVLFDCTYQASTLMPARLEGEILHNPNADISTHDYLTPTIEAFRVADDLANRLLPAIHPLRLSVKLEYSAFTFDCIRDGDGARRIAKKAIDEAFISTETLDDDAFDDATHLVGALGVFAKRGLPPVATRPRQNPPSGTGTAESTPPKPKRNGSSKSRRRSLMEEPADVAYSTRMDGILPAPQFYSPSSKGKERARDEIPTDVPKKVDYPESNDGFGNQYTGRGSVAETDPEYYEPPANRKGKEPVISYIPPTSPPGFDIPPTPPRKDTPPAEKVLREAMQKPVSVPVQPVQPIQPIHVPTQVPKPATGAQRPVTARGGPKAYQEPYSERFPPAPVVQTTNIAPPKAPLVPAVSALGLPSPSVQMVEVAQTKPRKAVRYADGGTTQGSPAHNPNGNGTSYSNGRGHGRTASETTSINTNVPAKHQRTASEIPQQIYPVGTKKSRGYSPISPPSSPDRARSPLVPASPVDINRRNPLPQANVEANIAAHQQPPAVLPTMTPSPNNAVISETGNGYINGDGIYVNGNGDAPAAGRRSNHPAAS